MKFTHVVSYTDQKRKVDWTPQEITTWIDSCLSVTPKSNISTLPDWML